MFTRARAPLNNERGEFPDAIRFGGKADRTYDVTTGDPNGAPFPDIMVANLGSCDVVLVNRLSQKRHIHQIDNFHTRITPITILPDQ